MSKTHLFAGVIVGSMVGSYIPMLWGDNLLSFSSVIFSGLGAFVGLYIVYKLEA